MFLDGARWRDADSRDALWREADSREELARDAGCRVGVLGRVVGCRVAGLELTVGADWRVVVTRDFVVRTVVSRTSRSRSLAERSPEGRAVVLREFVDRGAAILAALFREDGAMVDDGRLRNSIGSSSDRLIDDRSTPVILVLCAIWPARFVFVYDVDVAGRPERLFG